MVSTILPAHKGAAEICVGNRSCLVQQGQAQAGWLGVCCMSSVAVLLVWSAMLHARVLPGKQLFRLQGMICPFFQSSASLLEGLTFWVKLCTAPESTVHSHSLPSNGLKW